MVRGSPFGGLAEKKRGGHLGPPRNTHPVERFEVGPQAHLARDVYLK